MQSDARDRSQSIVPELNQTIYFWLSFERDESAVCAADDRGLDRWSSRELSATLWPSWGVAMRGVWSAPGASPKPRAELIWGLQAAERRWPVSESMLVGDEVFDIGVVSGSLASVADTPKCPA